MKLSGSEMILEIGCGTGLLAQEIVEVLNENGHLLAIDYSETMLGLAQKRLLHLQSDPRLELRQENFSDLEMNHSYDVVVAFNVGFFWKNPEEELKKIHLVLKPQGRVFIFHQAPFRIDIDYAEPLVSALNSNGFHVDGVKLKKLSPNSAVCVMATTD